MPVAPDSPVEVVQSVYRAWEDYDVVELLCALDPDVRWHQENGLPYRGDFVGRDAVAEIVRETLGDWSWLEVKPLSFWNEGALVAVLGAYDGCGRATGFRFSERFVHLWSIAGGRGVAVGLYRKSADAMCALDEGLI